MKNDNLPNHIAIIPDGNRRWAKERGLLPWDGHEAGAKITEKLIRKAHDIGIKNISFWGSSINNLQKRPLAEKKGLLEVYKKYFKELSENEDIYKNEIRINIIGRWRELFPKSIKDILEKLIVETNDYKKGSLNFFLAYNGDDEMIQTVQNIVDKAVDNSVGSTVDKSVDNPKITAKTIKENLMTRDIPEVDFLIRTGGEPHLSVGFMMWDIANAELYFSKKMYPDFGTEELEKSILDFQDRRRKKGK